MTLSQAGAVSSIQALLELEETIIARLDETHRALPERDKDEAGRMFRAVRDAVASEVRPLKQQLLDAWSHEFIEWPDNDDITEEPAATGEHAATMTATLPAENRPDLQRFAALAEQHVDRRGLADQP